MLRKKQVLTQLSWKICQFSIPISLGLFVLRINGWLNFLPGGILLFLIITSILSLFSYLILKTFN
jgi:ABC-type Na+ efflux pump permease subunit